MESLREYICDEICRYPSQCKCQSDLDEECEGCLIDTYIEEMLKENN